MKMNRWVRHILIVLEVGGGFVGLSLMLVPLKSAMNMPAHAVIGFSLFACVFLRHGVAAIVGHGQPLKYTLRNHFFVSC